MLPVAINPFTCSARHGTLHVVTVAFMDTRPVFKKTQSSMQEEESLQSSGQVPTRKRSLRPRCPRTQLEETYYLSPLDSQSHDDGDLSDDSAEDEEAAALLLEMGLMTDPSAENKAFCQYTASTKAGQNRQQANVSFRCTFCRQPAVLRGEKRPTFFCASCPSKGGAQKRAQRALHGTNGRLVSVTEASELLAARAGAALQPKMQVNCLTCFRAMSMKAHHKLEFPVHVAAAN